MNSYALHLKGHKLALRWSGVGDDYARGSCECGWVFKGWTHKQRCVRIAHRSHLNATLASAQFDSHIRAFKAIEDRARGLRIAARSRLIPPSQGAQP